MYCWTILSSWVPPPKGWVMGNANKLVTPTWFERGLIWIWIGPEIIKGKSLLVNPARCLIKVNSNIFWKYCIFNNQNFPLFATHRGINNANWYHKIRWNEYCVIHLYLRKLRVKVYRGQGAHQLTENRCIIQLLFECVIEILLWFNIVWIFCAVNGNILKGNRYTAFSSFER